jgi:tape measure domain-containing protein
MAFDLGFTVGLDGVGSYVANAKKVEAANKGIQSTAGHTSQGVQSAATSTGGFGSSLAALAGPIAAITAAATIAGTAIFGLGKMAISSAGQMEKTQVTFSNFLGSAREGARLVAGIQKQAAATPFEFPELAAATKNLLAFGIGANDVLETTSRLGDIAAGTGVGFADLAFVFGQVKTQGKAMTQDLYQFAQRGIPIFDELAKVMGISRDQVKKYAEQGKIGFKEVESVIKSLTSEGGKFFGMMEAQSQTYEGKLSTFQDAWKGLVRTLGNELLPIAKDVLTWLTNMIDMSPKYSDSLRKEQAELNTMAGALIEVTRHGNNTAESKKTQQFYINKLNKEYPEYLAGLNAETMTTETLVSRLREMNDQYAKKIKFAAAEEYIEDKAKAVAEAFKKQTGAIELAVDNIRILQKEGKIAVDENVSVERQVRQVFDQMSRMKELGMTMNQAISSVGKLGDGWEDIAYVLGGPIFGTAADFISSLATADTPVENLRKAMKDYSEAVTEGRDAQEAMLASQNAVNKSLEAAGLTMDDAKKSVYGFNEATAAAASSSGPLAGSIEALQKRIADLKKSQEAESTGTTVYQRYQKEIDGLEERIAKIRGELKKVEIDTILTKPTGDGTKEGDFTKSLDQLGTGYEAVATQAESAAERIGNTNLQMLEGFLNLGNQIKSTFSGAAVDAVENFGRMLGEGKSAGDSLKLTMIGLAQAVIPSALKYAGLFLLETATTLGFPVGIPAFVAGLALIGASGVASGALGKAQQKEQERQQAQINQQAQQVASGFGGGPSAGGGLGSANANAMSEAQPVFIVNVMGDRFLGTVSGRMATYNDLVIR